MTIPTRSGFAVEMLFYIWTNEAGRDRQTQLELPACMVYLICQFIGIGTNQVLDF